MSVGISFDAAAAFSSQPRFESRIFVAASNAPLSVTLSDNLNALYKAKASFEEEGIAFHRYSRLTQHIACLIWFAARISTWLVYRGWKSQKLLWL